MANPNVDSLKEIQALDRQIFQHVKTKKERPAALAKEEAEAKKRREVFAAKLAEHKSKRAEVDAKEKQDLNEQDDKIEKLSGQLNQAKSNKEYSALTTEINSVKADVGQTEEAILALMNQVESLGKEVEALKQASEEADRTLEAARRQLEADLAAIDAQLKVLAGERGKHTPKVEAEIMKLYERIQKNKVDGVGLVAVVDGCCQGCYMELTAQDQSVLAGGKHTVLCRSCGRMLYPE